MIEELFLAERLITIFPLWLRDKSVSLEERSEAFHLFYGLLEYSPYVDYLFLSIVDKNINLYEDFFVEKYERVDYIDLINKFSKKLSLSENTINELTKIAVISGYRGFVYDW